MSKKLRVLSLFSGIGAFEKALRNLGVNYKLINYCEINDHASKCYSKIHNENESKNLWDVSTIKTEELQEFDLLTHGSPCQDISVNGKQLGAAKESGTRSSLLWETVRIIKDTRPKYVVWENVKNLVSPKHIDNLTEYIEVLKGYGYESYYKVLNSKDFDLPQSRSRVFVVSILGGQDFDFPKTKELSSKLIDYCRFRDNDDITENFIRFYNENVDKEKDFFDHLNSLKPGRTGVKNMGMYSYDQLNRITLVDYPGVLSPTLSCRGVQNYCIKFLHNNRIYKPSPEMCFLLMGFSEDDFEKVKDVGTDSQLWDRAGNSIPVNVVQEIFKNLLKEYI